MCKSRRKWCKKKLIKENYIKTVVNDKHLNPDATASALWGRVVFELRRREYTALYTACGDVRKVSLDGDKLVVQIEDEYLYKIIAGKTNMELLEDTLNFVDSVAKLEVVYSKPEDYVAKDLEILKRKFGKSLKIRG